MKELKFLEVFLEVYLSAGKEVMLSSESRTCETPAAGCCSDFMAFKVPLKVVECKKWKIICEALFITVLNPHSHGHLCGFWGFLK